MSNKLSMPPVFALFRCSRDVILAGVAGVIFASIFIANVHAQGLTDTDPDWKELQFAPPASIATNKMLPVDMPPHLTLKFAVDTTSISVNTDGVVRYVIVASSANASNAMYEGIRCKTAEYKTYARMGSNGQWNTVQNPQWRLLADNGSRHTRAIAHQGVCDGGAPATNAAEVIRMLKNPPRNDP